MQILGIGIAILLFLMLIFSITVSDYGRSRTPRPKKTAITNPPWAEFVCPDCGHQDGNTADVVKCAGCGLNLLRFRTHQRRR